MLGALFKILLLLSDRFLGDLNSSGHFFDDELHRDLVNSGNFLDNGHLELAIKYDVAFINLLDLLPDLSLDLLHQRRIDELVLDLLGLQCGDIVLHLGYLLLLELPEVVIF